MANRAAMVDEAIAIVTQLLAAAPSYDVLKAILYDLESIKSPIDSGNPVSVEFLDGLVMGQLAARQLETVANPQVERLVQLIYKIL